MSNRKTESMTRRSWPSHLRVYMTLPLLHSLSSRLGVVIQWASDLREFLKKVSGIQILPTMLLLSISSFMELLNLSRLSYHVWAKKMSMVYSCRTATRFCFYWHHTVNKNISWFLRLTS